MGIGCSKTGTLLFPSVFFSSSCLLRNFFSIPLLVSFVEHKHEWGGCMGRGRHPLIYLRDKIGTLFLLYVFVCNLNRPSVGQRRRRRASQQRGASPPSRLVMCPVLPAVRLYCNSLVIAPTRGHLQKQPDNLIDLTRASIDVTPHYRLSVLYTCHPSGAGLGVRGPRHTRRSWAPPT